MSKGRAETAEEAMELFRGALRRAGSPLSEKQFSVDGQHTPEFWILTPVEGATGASGIVFCATGEVEIGSYQVAVIDSRIDED